MALDPDGDVTLHDRYGELAGPPGSLVKLATASVAIEELGLEHRFLTAMAYDTTELVRGEDGNLALTGPLVVRPGGDPTLKAEDLLRLAHWLWSLELDSLAGPVIVDPSSFDERRFGPGWMWDDGPSGWAARLSAACVDGNGLEWRGDRMLRPLPGASRLRVVELPASGGRVLLSRDWQAQRDDFFLRRPRDGENREFPLLVDHRPRWTRATGPYCNAEHPDSLFRAVLEETLLTELGLAAPVAIGRGAFAAVAARPAALRLEHAGPRLGDVLDSLLTESWNLGAECVFQELAAAPTTKAPCEQADDARAAFLRRHSGTASWESASQRVESVLRDSLGLTGAFRIVDGSGLSRYNTLRPSQICRLLSASERRHPGLLVGLLPGPGEGTLRDLALPDGAELRAKTGSLRGRHGLAGYLLENGRPRYAFCLFISGQRAGAGEVAGLRDRLLKELVEWCGKDGKRRGK